MAPGLDEATSRPFHGERRVVPAGQRVGIQRLRPGARCRLDDERILRPRRSGLGEQLVLLPRFGDDRSEVVGTGSGVAEVDPPGVAGADQQLLRPGRGHIGQPVLSQQLLLDQLPLVRGQTGVAGVRELRDRSGIPAQIGRQHRRIGDPVVGHPIAREDPLHQRRQEHRLPLQALGLVHGQQLHRLPVRRHRLLQPGALLDLSLQVREQSGQRRVAVHVDVGRDRVQERAQLVAPRQSGEVRGGQQLHIQTHRGDRPAGQVQHRFVAVPAQVAELGRQRREPVPGGVGEGTVAGVLQGVQQADDLRGVDIGDGLFQRIEHAGRLGSRGIGRLRRCSADLGRARGPAGRAAPGRAGRPASEAR